MGQTGRRKLVVYDIGYSLYDYELRIGISRLKFSGTQMMNYLDNAESQVNNDTCGVFLQSEVVCLVEDFDISLVYEAESWVTCFFIQ